MTADISFVNGISFFILPSRNIMFTPVSNLSDRRVNIKFKDFKEIYMYYTNRGFRITTLHIDGEFSPLQALIHKMTRRQKFNLASASENVTKR